MHPYPVLRAERASVRYPTRRAPAFCGVTATIGAGERVLLAGPSGAGKSTLALALSGLIPHSVEAELAGTVEVLGQATSASPPGALAGQVGIAFQDPSSQFTMLTVEDEVAFGLENVGVVPAQMPARVREALVAVGLADRAGWRIDRLSGGQQQRLVLAAALALRPAVLILDEPTAHLDPRSATQLYQHVRAIADARATTLVVVEHDVDKVVPHLARRCLLLTAQGTLAADDAVAEVFGTADEARQWVAEGVWLPSSAALALALGAAGERLPIGTEAAAHWLAARPAAQRRLWVAAQRARERARGKVVIDARDLRRRYVGAAGSHVALHGVSLQVHEGELVAVVGPNGSGKTTLLRALSALTPLERGLVAVDGTDLHKAGPRAAAHLVAHVFQNPESGFIADTVADEIAYGPRALGWSEAEVQRHVDASLARFGLTALARANPFTLSQGQKRRLSVAVALILGPRALLLDEPTFGQDRRSALALMREIAALRDRGMAVVVATHDAGLVLETADRVVALVDGRIAFDGSPWAFVDDERLLAMAGQEQPALSRILARARALGADVPRHLRWQDLPDPAEAI